MSMLFALALAAHLARRIRRLRIAVTTTRRAGGKRGYIYAFTDYGQILPVVKIGRATDADSRLASHKTAAPFGIHVFCVLKVRDAVAAEALLHKRYQHLRIRRNGEWFWLLPMVWFEMVNL